LKKVKSPGLVEAIKEEEEEEQNPKNVFRTMEERGTNNSRNNSADGQELEVLNMLSGCMSEISVKYDKMTLKFQEKIDHLEITSKSLADKFEKL
jgi:tetrahydromethanopterin S-methyltransferase subunit H